MPTIVDFIVVTLRSIRSFNYDKNDFLSLK